MRLPEVWGGQGPGGWGLHGDPSSTPAGCVELRPSAPSSAASRLTDLDSTQVLLCFTEHTTDKFIGNS